MRIAILHESWLTHDSIDADQIAVLAVLALHAGKDGTCWPSQGLLATLLGRSRPWVNKVISKLVEIGLVERTHRTRDDGGDRACLYRLIAPMDIKTPCPAPEAAESPTDNTVSSEGNTPSHNRDSITTELEIIQDSPPAGAREDSIIRSFQAEIPAEDWQPSDADLLWAMERYPDADLTSVTERFVNRCRSKGYRYKDLGSAWRSWLADDHGKVHQPPRGISRGRGIQKQSAAQSRFDAWASVAQQASREVRHAA